jgi:glucosylceramidase
MKTTKSVTGGYLADGMYKVLAQYYRKFIEAYAAEGIPVYAMTIQNEPGQITTDYPSMGLTVAQAIELTKAIKEEFKAHGITTKVWIFDHNFDHISYPIDVLKDPEAYAAADGTAFHDYGGNITAMTDLHTIYPDKEIFFTERSAWGVSGMDKIAQYIRNWACSYNSWVTMLDQNKSPKNTPFNVDPTLLIKGTSSADQYWATPEAYLLGQYAKYVKFGAKRIESNYGVSGGLTNVAFQNPDGSIVMVVMNNSSSAQNFRVLCEGNQFIAQLPAKTVGTYIWQSGLPLLSETTIPSSDQAGPKLLALYPNPATDNIVNVLVQDFDKNEKVVISIYDFGGRKVCESNFTANINGKLETPVKINQLASQVYIISIKGDSHDSICRKLIVQ